MARLHALLSLAHEDAASDDHDFVCVIDPWDPRVHDICMLSDVLADLLRQLSALPTADEIAGASATSPMS